MQTAEAAIERYAAGEPPDFGVVVIGRNEGARLKRCIEAVMSRAAHVVYVDSCSSDGSASWARERGVEVLELDPTRPFTAARARNAGWQRLVQVAPSTRFVQFVDGDCELAPGWLATAKRFLSARSDVAAVCGRLRERYPERSIYNRLCDIEWGGPDGETLAVGGLAMLRVDALLAAKGYLESLIAGEEPELCVRLRAAGWRVWRLRDEMGMHDANILRFGQWWRRARRSGHAFAEGAYLHGAAPERHDVREMLRAVAWGVVLPGVIVACALLDPRALLLVLIYPIQVLRLALRYGVGQPVGWLRAMFMTISRFAEASGVLRFHLNRIVGRHSALIEYK